MERRKIAMIFRAKPVMEGAGVKLKRAFGYFEAPLLDPFLLLDDFRSDSKEDYIKGFPWHPHRGIETITYVIYGDVEHGDSLGNKGTISSGDVQWMTAGSGIIHEEMPKGDGDGRMGGFQLWTNLPASLKMCSPRYRDVKSEDIPSLVTDEGARIKVICGKVDGASGPVKDIASNPEYLDITLDSASNYLHLTKKGHTVVVYVIEGSAFFGDSSDPDKELEGKDTQIEKESAILFGDGDKMEARAGERGCRFLLLSGMPLGEPVAWRGPIVMNSEEELETAFDEYRRGTFIRDAS